MKGAICVPQAAAAHEEARQSLPALLTHAFHVCVQHVQAALHDFERARDDVLFMGVERASTTLAAAHCVQEAEVAAYTAFAKFLTWATSLVGLSDFCT